MEKKIYIFGAGAHGQLFYDVLSAQGFYVLAFLDSYSKKRQFNNCLVITPQQAEHKECAVYVSLGLLSSRVKRELVEEGFSEVYDLTESILKIPGIINALKVYSLWYSSSISEMLNGAAITELRGNLSDGKSRKLLDEIVAFRTTFTQKNYVLPDHHVQYFPNDIEIFSSLNEIRMVDAGSYTGDSVRSLLDVAVSRELSISYMACFEPEEQNFTRLQEGIEILQKQFGDFSCFLYPAAVWRCSEKICFTDNLQASSCVADGDSAGESLRTVFGMSIDDCLYHAAPNFIKMDVEGAEKQALKGAKKTIKRYQPVLAICLYHRPKDLWEIPLYIKELVPEYSMYLRVYGDMLLETVLYCLPPGKTPQNVPGGCVGCQT